MAPRRRAYSEWLSEERITLDSVPQHFPNDLQRSLSTLVRYCDEGVESHTTGVVVYLECMEIPGGARMTSMEAVRRFLDAINGIGVTLEPVAEAG